MLHAFYHETMPRITRQEAKSSAYFAICGRGERRLHRCRPRGHALDGHARASPGHGQPPQSQRRGHKDAGRHDFDEILRKYRRITPFRCEAAANSTDGIALETKMNTAFKSKNSLPLPTSLRAGEQWQRFDFCFGNIASITARAFCRFAPVRG